MASTGAKFPTAGTQVSESPWLDDAWTGATDIFSDNGTAAQVTAATFDSGDQTSVLKASGFDFSSIPDDAIIQGVTAITNAWYANGTGSIDLMQLLDTGGSKVGTNLAATPVALTTTTTATQTWGSSSNLWGNTLTPAWVKDADFGVAIGCLSTAANTDVFVDYVTLNIEWHPAINAAAGSYTITGSDADLVIPVSLPQIAMARFRS